MSSGVTFPSPVGGVPLDLDFVPSVLFASLYSVVTLAGLYHLIHPATRTLVVVGTFSFVVERVVVFALRAKQSKTPAQTTDSNLTIYWQLTFAIGYITMFADLTLLLRCLYVHSIDSAPPSPQSTPEPSILEDMDTKSDIAAEASTSTLSFGMEGQPRAKLRLWYRYGFGALALLSVAPIVVGTVMAYAYVKAETDAWKAATVQDMRYATNIMALVLFAVLQGLSFWALFRLERVPRAAAGLVFANATLLNIITIYRFAVLPATTASLTSTSTDSLNATGDKVAFYVFHAAPELLSAGTLMFIDVKKMFGLSLWGVGSTKPTTMA